MGAVLTQLFPPSPTFTEKDIPSLAGKVFIVTGGNAGVGLEVVNILYSKGATVYMAGRSSTNITSAIQAMKDVHTASSGHLKSLHLDLGDLATIGPCVSTFLAQESRLDVLWNNAGISNAAPGSVTVQGHETHMGTNCVGPFLLTKLLLPILRHTAQSSPKASVRVVFTSSGIIDMTGPLGAFSLDQLAPGSHSHDKMRNYSASKTGNWLLASEFDKRARKDGIVCVVQTPGTLKTKGWDGMNWAGRALMGLFMHEAKKGAYTELWCGLSPDVKLEDGGRFALPWGRWVLNPRKDILEGLKTKEEGGTGVAAQFWNWCEEQTIEFAGAGR